VKIDNYISELLYDHDCVIVMDLGGIIAHYHPASVNKALNVVSPPSKRLAFNASLRNNDGLLAYHISSREALNYADACNVIKEYVESAKKQMADGKKHKIERVGVLFFDKDKNLQFLPDQNANYLIDSFGLTPVHAPLIKREQPVTENADDQIPGIYEIPQRVKPREIRIFKWKVLEVIPAAAVLTFLLMVPPVLNQLNTNMSTLLPFSRMNEFVEDLKGVPHGYQPVTINYPSPFDVPPAGSTTTLTNGEPEENIVATKNAKTETEIIAAETISPPSPETGTTTITENSANPVPSDLTVTHSATFHIIGGSFRSFENAEKLVADLKSKNFEAAIIGQNKSGLYLVSLLSSNSFTQITDALPEVKSSAVPTAWIYKK